MRKDMSKVIVERQRRGSGGRAGMRPGRSVIVADDDGEPLRAPRGGRAPVRKPVKTKWLNENLAPLKRYLRKQVGRPWNKVYSEISENLKPTSTVQQHVRDHIEDFVALKTRTKDGAIFAAGKWGGERALADEYRPFFVHPRTKLLLANPDYRSWSKQARAKRAAADKERAERMRVIDAKTQLHKLRDDVWWEVKLAKLGDGREADALQSAGLTDLPLSELYGREGVRALSKRQLNKAEIKRLKLR
jgi:hypothetical protein